MEPAQHTSSGMVGVPPPAPEPNLDEEQPVVGARLKEWSYSRREVFEKCQRLYYYQYYGARKQTAKTEPLKERLRFLKDISNRYMRAGDIMHWAIDYSLKARAKKGSEWSQNFLIEFARKRFQEDLSFSRGYKDGTPLPAEMSAPVFLMELYYGMADAEKHCGEIEAKMVRALQSFQTVVEYVPFRAGSTAIRRKSNPRFRSDIRACPSAARWTWPSPRPGGPPSWIGRWARVMEEQTASNCCSTRSGPCKPLHARPTRWTCSKPTLAVEPFPLLISDLKRFFGPKPGFPRMWNE